MVDKSHAFSVTRVGVQFQQKRVNHELRLEIHVVLKLLEGSVDSVFASLCVHPGRFIGKVRAR